MRSDKGDRVEPTSLGHKIIMWILIILLVVCLFGFMMSMIKTVRTHSAYKNFCQDKQTYCYCDFASCTYKTTYSSINGFDNNTLELCKLAKELGDRKVIFEVGCDG